MVHERTKQKLDALARLVIDLGDLDAAVLFEVAEGGSAMSIHAGDLVRPHMPELLEQVARELRKTLAEEAREAH